MTQDLLVPIFRFLTYIGILLVATPLLGAAIMRKAFEKVAYRDASYGQLAQIYFAACCASYVLAVAANYLPAGVWQTILQWAVIVSTQMIYLPVVLGWTTKKRLPGLTVMATVASVLLTNVLMAAAIYVFLIDTGYSASST